MTREQVKAVHADLACLTCGGHGKVCRECGAAIRRGVTICSNQACGKPLGKYRPVHCGTCAGAGTRKGAKW